MLVIEVETLPDAALADPLISPFIAIYSPPSLVRLGWRGYAGILPEDVFHNLKKELLDEDEAA